ncbi:MAG: hypothetical protein AAFY88_09955, partial [Acidobacteriota bacterium]
MQISPISQSFSVIAVVLAAITLGPTPAQAQRVSIAGLQQRIQTLEAGLAEFRQEPLAGQDSATEPGLTITKVMLTFDGGQVRSMLITGQNFGPRQGAELVRFGTFPTLIPLQIVTWTDTFIEAEIPLTFANEKSTHRVFVANEIVPASGGEPVLQVDEFDVSYGTTGPQGPIGPTGADGAD